MRRAQAWQDRAAHWQVPQRRDPVTPGGGRRRCKRCNPEAPRKGHPKAAPSSNATNRTPAHQAHGHSGQLRDQPRVQ